MCWQNNNKLSSSSTLNFYALHPDPVINHYSCSRSVSSEIRTLVFLFTSFQTSRILCQEVWKFYESRNCRFHFLFEHANILRHARSMQVTTAECCLFLHHLYVYLLLESFFFSSVRKMIIRNIFCKLDYHNYFFFQSCRWLNGTLLKMRVLYLNFTN